MRVGFLYSPVAKVADVTIPDFRFIFAMRLDFCFLVLEKGYTEAAT